MKNAAASFVLITNKDIIKEIATWRIRRRKMKKMRKKISKVDMKRMEDAMGILPTNLPFDFINGKMKA